jgi:hypothetical protein
LKFSGLYSHARATCMLGPGHIKRIKLFQSSRSLVPANTACYAG